MTEKDFIWEHWESQALKHGSSFEASWGDRFMIDLEIEAVGHFIHKGAFVLDVGCANGFAAFTHLDKDPSSIIGLDYSGAMISAANRELEKSRSPLISFEVGDVRNIRFPNESFDVVYTTRVLINLPTWEQQVRAIDECLRVCKTGGKVVLSEAFWEPLVRLNALRAIAGLPPLVEHDFNRYLKLERLRAYLDEKSMSYEEEDFSSVYYLGSRFLRELVTDASQYPGYSNPVNGDFYDLERKYSGGSFGIQRIFAIHK